LGKLQILSPLPLVVAWLHLEIQEVDPSLHQVIRRSPFQHRLKYLVHLQQVRQLQAKLNTMQLSLLNAFMVALTKSQ
jgi:hypothetical protein